MLDKVAFSLEDYIINDLLDDEKNLDEAASFRTKIKEIIEQIFEEFKESLKLDQKNGKFAKALIKIFTILLNTKCSSIAKLKKNHQSKCRSSYNVMARTKATLRGANNGPVFVPVPGHRVRNKNIMNRRNPTFKIKKVFPDILRSMNVYRKAIYFSDRRRLKF